MRKLHLAHHFDRADTCAFDYREFITKRPLLQRTVLALEWCFIPAVECIMHANIAFSWANAALPRRRRVIAATGSVAFAAFWAALGYYGGVAAVALYALSTNIFLQVLAVHDAFQHTYEVLVQAPGQPYTPGPGPRDAKYEEENTFSDLISLRYPLLNMLVLNFGVCLCRSEGKRRRLSCVPCMRRVPQRAPQAADAAVVQAAAAARQDVRAAEGVGARAAHEHAGCQLGAPPREACAGQQGGVRSHAQEKRPGARQVLRRRPRRVLPHYVSACRSRRGRQLGSCRSRQSFNRSFIM